MRGRWYEKGYQGAVSGEVSRTWERKKEQVGPTGEIGAGWPPWIYSCALSPVPETFPRACPTSLRLGGHSRWHSVHKAAPTRKQSVFFSALKRRLLCWELTTSGAFLCLVSPLPSGQLTNELSGLTDVAAFDFKESRQGRLGGRLRQERFL